MSKVNPIVLALAIAGTSVALGACGDDDEGGSNTTADAGGKDGGGGGESDAGGGKSDAGGGKSDAGTDTPSDDAAVVEVENCPDHPNVTDQGEYCVIVAPSESPITEDLDLSSVKDRKILISGPVFVGEDVGGEPTKDASAKAATLTIAPGTTVYAEDETAFVLITRGSKIIAQGTKNNPIVFTSAVEPLVSGSWGGLWINGRAPHNQGTQVLGEAGTGNYAGTDADDDSGVISYVRIEFGGAQIDMNNEFNGLTLAAVGAGTQIDHVHVHRCNDDGIEFFGGTVNAKYVVSTGNGDDGLDWTSGYTGNIQFAVVQQWAEISSSDPRGIEADNDQQNPTASPISNPTLSNLTIIGSTDVPVASNADGAMLRRGTHAQIHNSVFLNFKNDCVRVDGEDSQAAIESGDLVYKHVRISCETPFYDEVSGTLFSEANDNAQLDAVDVLEDGFSTAPNFLPKSDSGLLEGGEVPAGDFFDAAEFIGALGTEDWTKDGTWVKISE